MRRATPIPFPISLTSGRDSGWRTKAIAPLQRWPFHRIECLRSLRPSHRKLLHIEGKSLRICLKSISRKVGWIATGSEWHGRASASDSLELSGDWERVRELPPYLKTRTNDLMPQAVSFRGSLTYVESLLRPGGRCPLSWRGR